MRSLLRLLCLLGCGAAHAQLPTTNLTLHLDASNTDDLFTTYVGTGVHTGTPADGNEVDVWDDEGDGIADVIGRAQTAGPEFRSSTPLMLLSNLDFDGTADSFAGMNQVGDTARNSTDFITTTAFIVATAIYPESITLTSGTAYSNHGVFTDGGGQWFGLYLKETTGQDQACIYNWDGSQDQICVDVTAGETSVIIARHDSGTIYISKNCGAESSTASGTTSGTGTTRIGLGDTAFYNGRIGELAVYNVGTGATAASACSYLATKWLGAAASGLLPRRRRN
jgi:hypothetical protein